MRIEETTLDGIIVRDTVYEAEDLSTKSQRDSWLDTCSGCDHFKNKSCLICDCISEVKMTYSDSKCPIGKW